MDYLSVAQVAAIHARLIRRISGDPGLLNPHLLASAVARPQATFGGEDLYPSVWDKAAALMASLIRNHPFVDKNERTALVAAGLFLERNGYSLTATNEELYLFTLRVVRRDYAGATAAAWLQKHTRATAP